MEDRDRDYQHSGPTNDKSSQTDFREREIQDLKELYLVRDPRATLQSRKGRDWCVATPSCHKPETLCGDLVNDFDSFLDLRKTFPDRIK